MSEKKVYEIGGNKYTQSALVFGQIKWLRDVLCGNKLHSITSDEYVNLILKELPKFLAIVLYMVDSTQSEKVKSGESGVTDMEIFLSSEIPSHELYKVGMEVMNDFFDCNPGETAIMIDGEYKRQKTQ